MAEGVWVVYLKKLTPSALFVLCAPPPALLRTCAGMAYCAIHRADNSF